MSKSHGTPGEGSQENEDLVTGEVEGLADGESADVTQINERTLFSPIPVEPGSKDEFDPLMDDAEYIWQTKQPRMSLVELPQPGINILNDMPSGPGLWMDTSLTGEEEEQVTPLDALRVINFLNNPDGTTKIVHPDDETDSE